MTRSTTPWTTALAATALLALPTAGRAQTGATIQQPPATTSTPALEQAPAHDAAREHLREARTALDRIDNENLTGEARTKVAELKRHFSALERSVGANDRASATGAAARSPRATEPRGNTEWTTEVVAIERLLTELIGPDAATAGATAGTTGATGATGTTGAARASVTMDAATREALEDVRKHVTKFAAAMSGTDTPRTDVPATPAAPATPATPATPPTTGTTDTTTAQATAEGQAGAQVARRHLTEARDTLSELTRLPQAAQLSGDARAQVSQLIANFNELITTQDNWRASYVKVEANLEALLGPDTATATTGTAGAVGTTGVTDLDPDVRAKLVELRAKLNEFERAAGGGAAQPDATDPSATDPTAPTPPRRPAPRLRHRRAPRARWPAKP